MFCFRSQMDSGERKTVELALLILRNYAESKQIELIRAPALRLALRVVMPHVGRHACLAYWNICEQTGLQRRNNLLKHYAVIEAYVRHSENRHLPNQ